ELAPDQAVTTCAAVALSDLLPRMVFPSILITSPLLRALIDAAHSAKQLSNAPGSKAAKKRLNVSWVGMPLGNGTSVLSHSSLALPKSSISFHVSAPQM